jgi:hypothetical protein
LGLDGNAALATVRRFAFWGKFSRIDLRLSDFIVILPSIDNKDDGCAQ